MTIFSKILSGQLPAFKIAENDRFLAFLDINPIALGHTLVIPKIEIDYIFDLDDELLSEMIVFSKSVGKLLQSKIECKRIGLSVIGLEVPHAHIHLIPLNSISDMNFEVKLNLSINEIKSLHEKIIA
jgi:histidine triad (HIT) family protein